MSFVLVDSLGDHFKDQKKEIVTLIKDFINDCAKILQVKD